MVTNINAEIIEPAFQALLECVNTDSELFMELEMLSVKKGPFAVQRKASKIIESFPWPIGKEFSTLFSSSYNYRDQKRILKIFRVAEKITQFFAFCWLIQLWDAKRTNPDLELSADFNAQFKHFHKPSIGTYLGLIRSCSALLLKSEQPIFFRRSDVKNRTRKLIAEIEKLTVFRNKEIHFKEEIICEDAEDILANILVHASFIANYPMVSVKDISVARPKLSDAKYVHVIDQLNSQRSEFLGGSIELDQFSDSYSVLLIENLASMGKYLNLSPLIINTEPFLESRGRSAVLQGLYMFAESVRDKIKYSFVNASDIHNLSDMPQSHVFRKQWNNLFEVLAQ